MAANTGPPVPDGAGEEAPEEAGEAAGAERADSDDDAGSGEAQGPDLVLTLRARVLEGIAAGVVDPGEALERGDLRVRIRRNVEPGWPGLRVLMEALCADAMRVDAGTALIETGG